MYLPIKQPAVLHCKAVGHPQPKIIWYKDGVLLQHRGRFKISTNGTLLITKVKKKDAGRYRCKALNEIDWIAREVLIHVYSKPICFFSQIEISLLQRKLIQKYLKIPLKSLLQ